MDTNHAVDDTNPTSGGKRGRASARWMAATLSLAMVASACGGSDADSDTSLDGDSSATTSFFAEDSGGGDAEGALVTSDEATDRVEDASIPESTEAMDDSSGSDEEADAASAPAEKAVEGGFFEVEPEPEPDAEGQFADYGVRPFVQTSRDPISTFALDVDTGSYTVGRRYLDQGQLPPSDSVRVEEYVNSIDYDYRSPSSGLGMTAEGGPSPFSPDNVVVAIGVQAERVANEDRPPASLVFVIDTSGSMDRDDRIGLVRRSLVDLVRELDRDDTVAIVTYSSNSTVLLEPTSVADADRIIDAIEGLRTTGSTNLEAGLERGYDLAREAFVRGGINRVILASDGIANVGLTDPDSLAAQLRSDADAGIHLLTVGVGMDGYNDVLMEQLADSGDGFYAYIDTDAEANELFGDRLVSTLLTVAIDGKIQVEFDSNNVLAYRLIGFENRAVLDSDFRNDAVDAGELGAGHQVTAIYELTLASGLDARSDLGTVNLRWQDPDSGDVIENRLQLTNGIISGSWTGASDDLRLAVVMASFAEILRGSPFAEGLSLDQVQTEVDALASGNPQAAELSDMVRAARNAG